MARVEGLDRPKEVAVQEQQRIANVKAQQAIKVKAPPAPEGYELTNVVTYTPAPLPPSPEQRAQGVVPNPKNPPLQITEYTYTPKVYEVPTSYFGPKTEWYDPKTGELRQEVTTKSGEKILVSVYSSSPSAIKGASFAESQAMSGLGLTTVAATGITAPILGAFAVGGMGAAETVKLITTGEHLTPSEAISAAAAGQLVGLGVVSSFRALQPRVQRSVDASYREAVESQTLYKPTAVQRLAMKLTGAKQPSLAQEIVGAGEARPISMSMLKTGKITGPEESYFWDMPTPKTAQAYVRGYPATKSWVETTLVKRVYMEGLFTTTVPTKLLLDVETKLEPKYPYIPTEPAITRAVSIIPQAFRTGLLLSLYAVPLQKSRQSLMQALQVKQVTRTVQRQMLLQKSVQDQSLAQSQIVQQVQQQKQKQKLVQVQVQKQKVEQILQQRTVTASPLIAKATTVPKGFTGLPRLGGSGGGGREQRGFGVGRWHYKRNPVATLEQNLRNVTGMSKQRASTLGKIANPKRLLRAKPKKRSSRKKSRKKRSGKR